MKSPSDIAAKLARDWHKSALRIERLLSAEPWPLKIPIGKPSAEVFSNQPAQLRQHLECWKAVAVGQVEWQTVSYRAGDHPVSMPLYWLINKPSEWVAAAADSQVSDEFQSLAYLLDKLSPCYQDLLIKERSLWRNKVLDEVLAAAQLADSLSPGCAAGRPLRLLAGWGVDTKFFERNRTLLTKLLDQRFSGAASEQGLETFLDALDEKDHWLLVIPLDPALLPFKRLRLTTNELAETTLPGSRLLVIENERCEHLLPAIPDTLAILGAGLDLQWLQSPNFDTRQVAYWGDIDTWGLLMLSRARQYRPALTPLLMDEAVFQRNQQTSAVVEPVTADTHTPTGLSESEERLYQRLLSQPKGRLEQEYLPEEEVHQALCAWMNKE